MATTLDDVLTLARDAGISGIGLSENGRVIIHGPRIPFKIYRRLRRERKTIQEHVPDGKIWLLPA